MPAIRPRQESIPLALARKVVLNISGADAYKTALKYWDTVSELHMFPRGIIRHSASSTPRHSGQRIRRYS